MFINNPSLLKEGEAELIIQDAKTFETKRVMAIISNENKEGFDRLQLRYPGGRLNPNSLFIKITKEYKDLLNI
jgi:hypothetical protein